MAYPLRLIADDLTGALDSAAAFGSASTPVPVVWQADAVPETGTVAFDTGTRERDPTEAREIVERIAGPLFKASDCLAYKKIDSLLRGSEAAEIDAILAVRSFRSCVVAPAFPAQGRATRGSQQGYLRPSGIFEPLSVNLRAQLESLGHRTNEGVRGAPLAAGISFFDAENDSDLDRIVETASAYEDVLWIGSAGLASALARRYATASIDSSLSLGVPVLGLFGTNHPVMQEQLEAVQQHRIALATPDNVGEVAHLLAERGVAFVTAELADGTTREIAAEQIASLFAALAQRFEAPATLVVAGGETLRGLCEALGANGLAVTGEVLPGIPCSVLLGGRWAGTVTISKSGAFGAPDFLQNLLAGLPVRSLGVSAV